MFVLSQLGMMTCSKMYGMLRDPGVPLSLEQVARNKINWFSWIVGAPMCFSIFPWSQINILCHVSLVGNWFSLYVAMCPWSLTTFDILSATWRRMAGSWTTRASTRRTSSPTTARGQSSRPLWVSSLVLLIFFCKRKRLKYLMAGSRRYRDVPTIWQLDIL